METCDVAIVGGGIAGAAVAWQLASRAPGLSVLVLERETGPGLHASGRNASLLLQNDPDPLNGPLAMAGRQFYSDPPEGLFAVPPFRAVGSLRLASGPEGLTRQGRDASIVRGFGLDVETLTPEAAVRLFPLLDPARITGAVWCAGDGVLDIQAIVRGFLEDATRRGVRLGLGRSVTRLRLKDERVVGLETSADPIDCGLVVLAAGGWAGALGAAAGAPVPLRPTRRHLAVTEPIAGVTRDWPFVWDVDTPFYARPESGGLLLCACDEGDAPDCDESERADELRLIATRAAHLVPALTGVSRRRAWAGLRTLTPDGHDLIGPDPRRPGLFWMAGLGGHGMTAAPILARHAADLILNVPGARLRAAPWLPERVLNPAPRAAQDLNRGWT